MHLKFSHINQVYKVSKSVPAELMHLKGTEIILSCLISQQIDIRLCKETITQNNIFSHGYRKHCCRSSKSSRRLIHFAF